MVLHGAIGQAAFGSTGQSAVAIGPIDIELVVSDNRTLDDIRQCLYPNNPFANRPGWVVGNLVGFSSEPALQKSLYTASLRWAVISGTFLGTLPEGYSSDALFWAGSFGTGLTIDPMILLRQRLNMTNRATCV
jgi:hypothetical protein